MLSFMFLPLVFFGLQSSLVHYAIENPTDKGGITDNLFTGTINKQFGMILSMLNVVKTTAERILH
jgi:hypothetical protein